MMKLFLIDKSLYFKNTFIEKFEQDIRNAFYDKQTDTLIIFLEKKIYFFLLNNIEDEIEVTDIREIVLNEEIFKVGEDNRQSSCSRN